MVRNYLIVALRNIRRHKGYSLINIVGLAVGIASCLLILLFVRSELSYDRFHEKADQIFRVGFKFHVGTNQFDAALGPCPLAGALSRDFPEVEKAARIFARQSRGGDVFVRYGDKRYKENRFLWADQALFDILSFRFIEGNSEEVLTKPGSVVLTSEAAEKYFGQEEPLGKMLELEDGSLYMVKGVTEAWPETSHFHFDFLASFSSLPKSKDLDFYDTAVFTYILIRKNASIEQLETKLPEFSGKYMAPVIEKIMAVSYKDFLDSGNFIGFMTQPLLGIHLHSDWQNELEPQGNFNTVIIFSAIALLILVVACINFINLTTARSSQRANEVGVRKVVGSTPRQLVRQFLSESIFLSFIAIMLAMILVELSLPVFDTLVGKEFSAAYLQDWTFPLVMILGALGIGIAAGSYPALLLASFRPVDVLKGKAISRSKGPKFRNVLVVFQFCASIFLLVGTTVIYNQLHYIRDKDLGFQKEHVIVIQRAEKLGKQQRAFKEELKRNPDVLSVTFTDSLPQMLLEAKVFQKEGEGSGENNTFITITADLDFLETYNLRVIEGRYFERERSSDSSAIVLNEAAVKALDLQNPLERRLILVGLKRKPMDIIGIINDFHMEPLHVEIGPTAVILSGEKPGVLLSVRVRPGNLPKILGYAQEQWKRFTNNQPFEYVFFDDLFNSIYKSEIQAEKVITAFACLAVFIACLGLLGLASYTSGQRTKEIGIRKVLGATISGIVLLLNKDFIKWVLIANFIAWPLAYYAVNSWLQNFAYRVRLNLWMFMGASVATLVIALLTVSYQSIMAALGNPVDSLRYE